AGEARFHFEMSAEGMSSGPLKNSKATSISPNGEAPAKEKDPTRIGSTPMEEKKAEPKTVVPAGIEVPTLPHEIAKDVDDKILDAPKEKKKDRAVNPKSPSSPAAPENDR